MDETISVGDFIKLLWDFYRSCKSGLSGQAGLGESELSLSELLSYGHFRLWLEDRDERYPNEPLNRKGAARILHQFLKIECGLPDLADIKAAEELKDLYTCRVCANHIAQVYARKIIPAQEYDDCTLIFNHLEPVSKNEACEFIRKIQQFLA